MIVSSDTYGDIPAELKELSQWVCWDAVERDGKTVKLPINPKTGRLAKTDDSSTWGTLQQAIRSAKRFSGIGFVFSDSDPYVGIDIDKGITDEDKEIIEYFDSYSEYSQSGLGVHIICKGEVGDGHKNGKYEIYDRLRYFIFTGRSYHATPKPIEERQKQIDEFVGYYFSCQNIFGDIMQRIESEPEIDILDRIRASHQAVKFETLWQGDIATYASHSDADAALLSILRFWTGGNKAESFRLFGESGLYRKKWDRADYRERTWKSIDSGDVWRGIDDEMPSVIVSKAKHNLAPWRQVTSDMIRHVINGTLLEPLVELFAMPTDPPLTLESTLTKAIVMAGCALSRRSDRAGILQDSLYVGNRLSSVRILTAGGQVCNIYAILAAESGSGKDIGGLVDILAREMGSHVGNAGSAEGLADILMQEGKGNGYVGISEFSNWLDKRHWQARAAGFLTDAFNRGWFSFAMSTRGKTEARECAYCYPNILANIQPEAIGKHASTIDLQTGFLSRFLIAHAPTQYVRPITVSMDAQIEKAIYALSVYAGKHCCIEVQDKYLHDVYRQFADHRASYRGHWSRLVNEYGPRIAVMLATRDDCTEDIHIDEAAWHGAGLIIQWYYSQAERLFSEICDDTVQGDFERLLKSIYRVILSCDNGATAGDVSRRVRRKKQRDRTEAILELIDRGIISSEKIPSGKKHATVYRIVNQVPEWE